LESNASGGEHKIEDTMQRSLIHRLLSIFDPQAFVCTFDQGAIKPGVSAIDIVPVKSQEIVSHFPWRNRKLHIICFFARSYFVVQFGKLFECPGKSMSCAFSSVLKRTGPASLAVNPIQDIKATRGTK
jgi:hypothetical protein